MFYLLRGPKQQLLFGGIEFPGPQFRLYKVVLYISQLL